MAVDAIKEKRKEKKKSKSKDVASSPVRIDYGAPEDKPKKKKKKPSTALVVVEAKPKEEEGKKKKKKKPKTVEGAKRKLARLQEEVSSELALIEEMPVAVSSQEQLQLEEYLHMFRKLGKLIRKAEKQCMKSGQSRDYYALCTLMSQQREVIADIRSVSDMSGQVGQLETDMLQPMVRQVGQNMLDSFYQLKKLIVDTCRPEETQFALGKLNEITTEQGKFLQTQYHAALEKVNRIMLGG